MFNPNITFTPTTPDQSDVPVQVVGPPVIRGVSPESLIDLDDSIHPQLWPALPGTAIPGSIQTCPMDPLVKLLAGRADPDTQQDALTTLALMGATGTMHALRRAGGTSPTIRGMHHLAGSMNDLLQPDDDTAASTKQTRPPFFFTLGLNY